MVIISISPEKIFAQILMYISAPITVYKDVTHEPRRQGNMLRGAIQHPLMIHNIFHFNTSLCETTRMTSLPSRFEDDAMQAGHHGGSAVYYKSMSTRAKLLSN